MSIIKKGQAVKVVLSFLFAFLILYFFISRAEVGKIINILANANFLFLFVAFALFYGVFWAKSMRWKIFLANIGFKEKLSNITEIYFLGQFINTLLPARLGDFYKAHLMKKNFGIAGSRAFGTILFDRLFDLIFMAVLFFISVFAFFGKNIPSGIRKSVLLLFLLVFAALAFFIVLSRKKNIMIRLMPKMFKISFKNFQSAAAKSLNVRTIPIVLFITAIVWVLEFFIFYLITKSIGLNISFFLVIIIVVTANAVMTIPITPSGLGLVEAGIAVILMLVGVEKNIAISVALLNGLINYWNQLAFGLLVYIISKRS